MDYLAFPLDCRIGLCGSAYVRAAFSPEFISDVIGHLGAVAKNADGVFAVFIDHLSGDPINGIAVFVHASPRPAEPAVAFSAFSAGRDQSNSSRLTYYGVRCGCVQEGARATNLMRRLDGTPGDPFLSSLLPRCPALRYSLGLGRA